VDCLKYYSGELSAGLKKITRNSVKITRTLATHPNTVLPQHKGESIITRIAMKDKLKKCSRKWDCKERQNEEYHNLYCSPNIIRVRKWRKMEMKGHVTCMGDSRGACSVLVGGENRGEETTWKT